MWLHWFGARGVLKEAIGQQFQIAMLVLYPSSYSPFLAMVNRLRNRRMLPHRSCAQMILQAGMTDGCGFCVAMPPHKLWYVSWRLCRWRQHLWLQHLGWKERLRAVELSLGRPMRYGLSLQLIKI